MGRRYYPGMCVEKRLSCKKCGNIQIMHRLKSGDKSAGHIKHLYCVICRDRVEYEELPTHS